MKMTVVNNPKYAESFHLESCKSLGTRTGVRNAANSDVDNKCRLSNKIV